MSTTDYSVREIGDVIVVRLEIESLMGSMEIVRMNDELGSLLGTSAGRKVIVDLQRIKFVGSAALGMFMGMRNKVVSGKGRIVLVSSPTIDQLLKLMRATKLFEYAKDAESGIKMLQGK